MLAAWSRQHPGLWMGITIGGAVRALCFRSAEDTLCAGMARASAVTARKFAGRRPCVCGHSLCVQAAARACTVTARASVVTARMYAGLCPCVHGHGPSVQAAARVCAGTASICASFCPCMCGHGPCVQAAARASAGTAHVSVVTASICAGLCPCVLAVDGTASSVFSAAGASSSLWRTLDSRRNRDGENLKIQW